jgi:hypothetical protein
MRKIKLMAEYECYPLWDETSPIPDNLSPEMLPLSPALQTQINHWAQEFENTLDQAYPPDSGFLSRQGLEQFEATGRSLVAAIQAELGASFSVSYDSSAGVRE